MTSTRNTKQRSKTPKRNVIWAVLMEIIEDMKVIMEQNWKFTKELEELRNSIETSDAAMQKVQQDNEKLKKENNTLNKKVRALEENMSEITEMYEDIDDKVDELEQYSRKVCLEFAGIPKQRDEDTDEIVVQIGKKIGVEIKKEEVEISHRLPPNKQGKSLIIARFWNYKIKERL